MRSEDELRAAFQQKAAEAPRAADVLRAVRAREAAPRARRRRWLVPALAGAAAVAVGVPLGIALSHPSSTGTHKSAAGAQHGTAAAVSPSRAEGSAGGPGAPEATSVAICRPADVTVRLQGATLIVTSRGVACELARVPAVGVAGRPMPKPARRFGVLAGGATATATVRGEGRCAASGGLLQVDWGAGPVQIPGTTTLPSCLQVGTLQASAFTGLH
jgi:hypothetical protein